jgi:cysteine desulfuration protein SufE
MFESCIKKQNQVKALFERCANDEEKYKVLIGLGRLQKHLDSAEKIESNIVKGCQSTVYLTSKLENDVVIFAAEADALISAGLAEVLIEVYSGETPESILKCPPNYLEELGLQSSLSPNRANGLYSIHLRMKQDALRLLIEQSRKK